MKYFKAFSLCSNKYHTANGNIINLIYGSVVLRENSGSEVKKELIRIYI